MIVAVISDIHANLEALNAVLDEIGSENIKNVWILGDILGYGPLPNECIDVVRDMGAVMIIGNHDLGTLREIDIDNFNEDGKKAIKWQRLRLSPDNLDFIKGLPEKANPIDDVLMIHGSPRHPVWEYVIASWIADENFSHFNEKICFFGHTHLPTVYKKVYENGSEKIEVKAGDRLEISEKDFRWMINPGSVGQPRDGNPDSSFLIFDTNNMSIEFRRVAYQIDKTQEEMRGVGLPPFLRERLTKGL